MKIKVTTKGVKFFNDYLKTLPRGTIKTAMLAVTEYFIGNDSHGLKHSEVYKYVSRKSAYGKTFFTDKQRRWFFANKMQDKIGNNRTGESADAWKYRATSGGYNYAITNATRAAYFTRADRGQARQPAKVGWRKTMAVIEANMNGAIRSANAAVKRYLQSRK